MESAITITKNYGYPVALKASTNETKVKLTFYLRYRRRGSSVLWMKTSLKVGVRLQATASVLRFSSTVVESCVSARGLESIPEFYTRG